MAAASGLSWAYCNPPITSRGNFPYSFRTVVRGLNRRHPARQAASSETQGQSVRSGEKAERKFSSTGERAPGHRLLPYYFQKLKRTPVPDWAQKMLCIIVLNRRTVSPELFSWVRTRRLLSRRTCPVRSPSLCVQGKLLFCTFLTRKEGTTDRWVKNRWDAISRTNWICPENILFCK